MDPQNKPTLSDLDKLLPIAHTEHKEVFNAGNITKFIAVIIAALIVITSIATVFMVSSLKSKIDQKPQVKLTKKTSSSKLISTPSPVIAKTTDETASSDNEQVLAAAKKSCESYIYKQDIQRCTNPVVENIIGNYALIKVSNVRILLKKTENNWEFSTASDMSQNPDFCSTGTDNPAITEYCKSR